MKKIFVFFGKIMEVIFNKIAQINNVDFADEDFFLH